MLPWHAESEPYHHNNTECVRTQEIPREQRRPGEGRKPLCKVCSALAHAEEQAKI
jgi:hypothetical protein